MREPLPARLGAPGAPARCGYAESLHSPRDSLLASGFWLLGGSGCHGAIAAQWRNSDSMPTLAQKT